MARAARRLNGSLAVELQHPLTLWQREIHSSASAEQARLLLVDIAAERARARAAELAVDADNQPQDGHELRRSIEQWRCVAAGVAVGDAACLIALARGLAGERSDRRLGNDCLDASLTALALAARSGTSPERTVACLELLLMLPEIIGKSPTTTRRARGLASMFRVYRTLRWNVSGRNERDQKQSLSSMMSALTTIEAAAIRQGLFIGDLDREVLSGRMAVLAAVPQTPGNDGGEEDDLADEGCEANLLPSTRRLPLSGAVLGGKPSEGSLDQPLSVIPFPKFVSGCVFR